MELQELIFEKCFMPKDEAKIHMYFDFSVNFFGNSGDEVALYWAVAFYHLEAVKWLALHRTFDEKTLKCALEFSQKMPNKNFREDRLAIINLLSGL